MRPGTLFGLTVFSGQIDKTVPLTTDRDSVLDELTALKDARHTLSKGMRETALWDSMAQSLMLFGTLKQGDIFYIISDGMDNTSKLKPTEFQRYFDKLRVFALIPKLQTPDPLLPVGTFEELRNLAETSGGSAVTIPRWPPGRAWMPGVMNGSSNWRDTTTEEMLNAKRLSIQVAAQFEEILSYYRVEIGLPHSVKENTSWSLKIVGKTGQKNGQLTVAYPLRLVGSCHDAPEGTSVKN